MLPLLSQQSIELGICKWPPWLVKPPFGRRNSVNSRQFKLLIYIILKIIHLKALSKVLNNIESIYRPFALCKLQTCYNHLHTCYNHVIIIYSNFRSRSFDICIFYWKSKVAEIVNTISFEISPGILITLCPTKLEILESKQCSGSRLALISFPWFVRELIVSIISHRPITSSICIKPEMIPH